LPADLSGWSPGAAFFTGDVGFSGDRTTPNDGKYWLTESGFGQPVTYDSGDILPTVTAEIGEIPAITALHGQLTRVLILANALGIGTTFSYSLNAESEIPNGTITLDRATGLLTYSPSPADLRPFSLLVTASNSGQTRQQTLDINPFLFLPPETSELPSGHSLPDVDSADYSVSNAVTNAPIVFNDLARPVLDIRVAGKSVPIRKGHPNSLALLDGVKNIRSLKIYAETVSIEANVVLSDTQIEIYAEKVVYQNRAAIVSPSLVINTNTTEWFTPNVARMMLDYAKDVYLSAHYEEAATLFFRIQSLISEVRQTSNDDRNLVEYQQVGGEAETELFKLTTAQDFFGYPLGYVPPLSLEFVTSLYSAEIGPNLQSLFLAYKLQTAELNLTLREQEGQNAVNGLKSEIVENKQTLANTQKVIQDLGDESEKVNAEIVQLEQQLKSRQDELRQKAEDQRKKNQWLTVVNTVGAIASSIPLPYTQIAGKVINAGVSIAETAFKTGQVGYLPVSTSILEAIHTGNNLINTFTHADIGKGINAFESCIDDFETSQIIASIKDCATKINAGTKEIQDAWNKSATTLEPSLKLLADAKAQSPELDNTGLITEIQSKMAQVQELSFEISTNVSYSQQLGDAITRSYLGIDALQSAIREANSDLDLDALVYVKSLEHRALQRLRFYHYLVGKAYEYRLLQPYRGELNLEALLPRLQQIIANGMGADGTLPASEISVQQNNPTNLRGVYEDILSGIIQDVVKQALQGQRLQTTNYYQLSESELQRLNAGLEMTIDLGEQGKLDGRGEDFRIVQVNLSAPQQFVEDAGSQPGRSLSVDLTSSSFGKFRSGTNVLSFNNIAQRVWRADYQSGNPQNGLVQEADSFTQNTLLRELLGLRQIESDVNLALFIQRPAWSGLLLTKRVSNATHEQLQLKQLTIGFVLDYLPTTQKVPLHITSVPESLLPTIILDQPDLSGRQHGFGSLYRIYRTNSAVSLDAPETYGSWVFTRWEAISGLPLPHALATNHIVNVQLGTEGRELRAVYINAAATPDFTSFSFSGTDTFLMQVTGPLGSPFAIQRSNNLVDWTTFYTGAFGTTATEAADTGTSSASVRFYRVVITGEP
jgi:hypothetical protein